MIAWTNGLTLLFKAKLVYVCTCLFSQARVPKETSCVEELTRALISNASRALCSFMRVYRHRSILPK